MLKGIAAPFALFTFAAAGLFAGDAPRQAPELMIQLSPEKGMMLSAYKGKVVALEFLLTTCPHCQKTSQTLNRLQRELGSQGFQPVGVAINDMANMLIGDFTKQFNLTYPVGYTLRDKAINFLQHPVMTTMMMPQVVIIDRTGMIRHQIPGNDKLFDNDEKGFRDLIVPLLKPATVSKAVTKK